MAWPTKSKKKGASSVRAVVRKAIRAEQRRRGTWSNVFERLCEAQILEGCANEGGDPCCPESQYRIPLVLNSTLQGPSASVPGPYGDNLLVEAIRYRLHFTQVPGQDSNALAAVDYGVFAMGLKKGQVTGDGQDPQFYNPLKSFERNEGRFIHLWEHEWHPNFEFGGCTIATSTLKGAMNTSWFFPSVTGTSPGATITTPVASTMTTTPSTDVTTGTDTCVNITRPASNFTFKGTLRRKIALKADETLNLELAWARSQFPAGSIQVQPSMVIRGYIDLYTTSV